MSTILDPTRAPATVTYTFTSESVSEGHPDKVCDTIADAILDAHLAEDPASRVACEVLCKDNNVVLAGEITSNARVDFEALVHEVVREIGYSDADQPFRAGNLKILAPLRAGRGDRAGRQLPHQHHGRAGRGRPGDHVRLRHRRDAGVDAAPHPARAPPGAHAGRAAQARRGGVAAAGFQDAGLGGLRGEHARCRSPTCSSPRSTPRVWIARRSAPSSRSTCCPHALDGWYRDDLRLLVNPTGSFVQGGPSADAGLTGRKIIVDSYGGTGHHGGGAFSGKDPTKVDRSGAYFCRYVARQVVQQGLARRAEVQVAYAIGVARPVSVLVNTFGTGDERAAADYVRANFDFRPAAIIERLDLLRPIYRQTTNYGHFGKPELPWEQ